MISLKIYKSRGGISTVVLMMKSIKTLAVNISGFYNAIYFILGNILYFKWIISLNKKILRYMFFRGHLLASQLGSGWFIFRSKNMKYRFNIRTVFSFFQIHCILNHNICKYNSFLQFLFSTSRGYPKYIPIWMVAKQWYLLVLSIALMKPVRIYYYLTICLECK